MLFYTGKCTGNVIFRLRKVLPSDSSGKFMSPLTHKVLREVIGEPMYHLWIYFFGLALLVQPFKKWKASSNSLIAETIYWEVLGGKPTCMCEQRSLIHTNTGHKSNEREREREELEFVRREVSFLSPQVDKWLWPKCHAWLKHTITLKMFKYLTFSPPSFHAKMCVRERDCTPTNPNFQEGVFYLSNNEKKKKSNNIQSN